MYLIVRDSDGQVQQVFGYVPIRSIQEYANKEYPDTSSKWEMSIPFDYTGDIKYLPENRESV